MNQVLDIRQNAQAKENILTVKNDWTDQHLPDHIDNLAYTGEVVLKHVRTQSKKLLFKNCDFERISIKDEDAEGIEEFIFDNCKIQQLFIFKSYMKVSFVGCEMSSMTIENSKIGNLLLDATSIASIIFQSKSHVDKISFINESQVEQLDNKDAELKQVYLHASHVSLMKLSGVVEAFEIKQGATVSQLSFKEKSAILAFVKQLDLRRRATRKKSFSAYESELLHQNILTLAAIDYYESVCKYQELDVCIIKQRQINCELGRIRSRSFFGKLKYVLYECVLGKMFGWGVSLYNSLITSMSIIFIFAMMYLPYVYAEKGFLRGLLSVLYVSVNRFFGSDFGVEIFPFLESMEHIIGVIILTVFTGVLARKIIK